MISIMEPRRAFWAPTKSEYGVQGVGWVGDGKDLPKIGCEDLADVWPRERMRSYNQWKRRDSYPSWRSRGAKDGEDIPRYR